MVSDQQIKKTVRDAQNRAHLMQQECAGMRRSIEENRAITNRSRELVLVSRVLIHWIDQAMLDPVLGAARAPR
jgi:hypothetical protein